MLSHLNKIIIALFSVVVSYATAQASNLDYRLYNSEVIGEYNGFGTAKVVVNSNSSKSRNECSKGTSQEAVQAQALAIKYSQEECLVHGLLPYSSKPYGNEVQNVKRNSFDCVGYAISTCIALRY